MKEHLLLTIRLSRKSDPLTLRLQDTCYHLVIVQQGQLDITAGNKGLSLFKRTMLFLYPGHQLHVLQVYGTATILEFDPVFFHGFSMVAPSHVAQDIFYHFTADRVARLNSAEFKKIGKAIDEIELELRSGKDMTVLQSQLNLILIYTDRSSKKGILSRGNAFGLKVVSQLIELIDANYLDQNDAKWYAGQIGTSNRKLNALANFYTGKRVQQLVQERLIMEGEWLLINRQEKLIKEIAYELGFKEPGHFTTYFKRVKGITPLQFRRKHTGL